MGTTKEYADELVVTATAQYLKCEIVVVTSPPNQNPTDCLQCFIPPQPRNSTVLWIGHRHENHYVSLVHLETNSNSAIL